MAAESQKKTILEAPHLESLHSQANPLQTWQVNLELALQQHLGVNVF